MQSSPSHAWGRMSWLSGSLFHSFLFGFGLSLNLLGCWKGCTKKDGGGLHRQSFIRGISSWWHTLTQTIQLLSGHKERELREWKSVNSPQWSASMENSHISQMDNVFWMSSPVQQIFPHPSHPAQSPSWWFLPTILLAVPGTSFDYVLCTD